MDLFNLIRAPNPTKVKIGTRPRAAHEVPLLTVIVSRVIEMEEPAAATESSRIPSTIERSPLDFANENPSQQITEDDRTEDQVQGIVASEVPPPENATTMGVAPETNLGEEVAAMGPRVSKKCRKRGNDGADANAPPKVLRKDHAASRLTQSTAGGKSLALVGLETGSTFPVPAPQETPADASDPDPLSNANRSYFPLTRIFQGSCRCGRFRVREYLLHFHGRVTRKHKPARVGRDQRLSPGHPRSMPGPSGQPSIAREAKLLKKYVAQVARRDQRIMARENEIKNLEALLEAEADMKKAAKAKNAELVKELESLCA
ncbi:hypothetical protein Tco_1576532 [Tanacetum coccineum]